MEGSHWTEPATVKTAAMAGYNHKQGDEAQDCKTEFGAEITTNNDQGQQGYHEVLADVATTGLFNLCSLLFFHALFSLLYCF